MSTVSMNCKKRKQSDSPEPVARDEPVLELEKEVLELKKKLREAEERAEKAEALVESLKARGSSTTNDDEDFSDSEESVEDGDDPWTIKFNELRTYRIINGDTKVSEKGPHPQLGQWVTNQKRAYGNVKKGKKGIKISQDRINKLDSIGMFWGKAFPAPKPWDEHFEEMKKYQKAMGNCNVNVSPKDPSPLAKWVSSQRSEYRRFKKGRDSLLSLEQMGQLNDIGFNWKGPRLA